MSTYEQLADNFIRESGMAASTLGALAGINRTKMSLCLRGQEHFSRDESILISQLVHELRGLIADLTPIPISWQDCNAVQRLLAYRRNGVKFRLTVEGEEVSEEATR